MPSDLLASGHFKCGQEGIFTIPEELYHNHTLCPEVSRSMLVEMLQTSPAHVLALKHGQVRKRKPTPAMVLGSLMDKALLEPDRFKEGLSHWIRPGGINLNSKEGRAWVKDHPVLPALRPEEIDDIKGMIASVMRHHIARRIVEEGSKQESAFCIDPDTGLLRKVRPDIRLVENAGRLVLTDLKTGFPGCAAAPVWSVHCARMNYHIQDAFYSDVYRDLVGEQPFFLFMVVERKPPYSVRIFEIHEDGRRRGREKYKVAMEQFQQCKSSGDWPDYPTKIETIRLPQWELQPRDPIAHDDTF